MAAFYPYRSRRRYKSDGINADYTWLVKSEAIGKCSNPDSEYLIANEWIAASIGHFLQLPIPSCSLLRKKTSATVMFASQSFEGDTTPDDLIPELLYKDHSLLCAGIVVFDVLIANCDRHGGNVKVDNPNSPSLVRLIDSERCLFYIRKGDGISRLESRKDRLGVTDASDSGDEWHCLVELIDSADNLSHWVRRITDIPNWFIEAICRDVRRLSITENECVAVIDFLKERRDGLSKLILDHRNRFPLVTQWPLSL